MARCDGRVCLAFGDVESGLCGRDGELTNWAKVLEEAGCRFLGQDGTYLRLVASAGGCLWCHPCQRKAVDLVYTWSLRMLRQREDDAPEKVDRVVGW